MGTSIDRLVRKETALGAIRDLQPPEQYIGLQVAPFLDVPTDDVIFDYIKGGLQDGLAPARAEDAEAELAQKDELLYGSGRAAVVDWSLKTRYTASDVTRYREDLMVLQAAQGANVPLNLNYTGRQVQEFQSKLARDDRSRKRKLDNRIEWLITQALATSKIVYNDGKIKWTVDYGRPADQQDMAPTSGLWDPATNAEAMDPIGDLKVVSDLLYERRGVRPTRGLISQKAVDKLWRSPKFLAALGMPILGGTPNVPLDPNYLGLSGYTPEGALRIVEQATGISFTIYEGAYQTRAIGSTSYTLNRFIADDKVILLPSEGDLGEIDDTQIGFAKTLTAPHPEGNWSSGFYEWEDETKDPWGHVRGSGIKAFPVFPYMEYTAVLDVL
jgi:hypothetical protein